MITFEIIFIIKCLHRKWNILSIFVCLFAIFFRFNTFNLFLINSMVLVGLIPQPRSPTKCLWIEKSIKEGQGPQRTVEASKKINSIIFMRSNLFSTHYSLHVFRSVPLEIEYFLEILGAKNIIHI
jgi:hypothetical protein